MIVFNGEMVGRKTFCGSYTYSAHCIALEPHFTYEVFERK
jgi:hypothetical protein